MAEVSLKRVSKSYSTNHPAVRDLDLEIADGEFLVLVGPSGCGKSTTLRMIAGLEDATSGEIWIGGQNVTHVAPKNRDVAMVFQNYALYPHMTAYKNMAFGLELRYGGNWLERLARRIVRPQAAKELEARRREIPQRIEETAQTLGISQLLQRLPKELSGGERQRVALGRAIVRDPQLFLFDEPLSNLDAKLRVEMRRELKQLHRQLSATIVYVTHDQVEALTLGDRIAVMKDGVIQQAAAPMEAYRNPANRFVASFLGSPPMNLIRGQIERSDLQIRFVGGGLSIDVTQSGFDPAALDQQEVELGVRPEDVALFADEAPERLADLGLIDAGQADVNLVESLGDAELAHCRLTGSTQELAVKADARIGTPRGKVQLAVSPDQLHLFAADDGRNLRLSPAK
ncbi:ABC transporter ATP-binding protein [Blastopirellula retiformator]|uniref:Trehalose import ATP-binding protein SugC n=1 Tax=Blastopirellula retiformator TaxID=2527970 RepID=A0A5C5V281_9BACT|nr:ATP-binding cassette domain-containing protein [Blastopirellula retiformator]TWT31815.1 Trehalose import ATP-binding protein SugC [Blastopirellula retiformator]